MSIISSFRRRRQHGDEDDNNNIADDVDDDVDDDDDDEEEEDMDMIDENIAAMVLTSLSCSPQSPTFSQITGMLGD